METVYSPAACGKAVGPICSNLTGHVALNCTIAQSRKNPIPYLVAIRSAPASESKMTGRTWNVLQNKNHGAAKRKKENRQPIKFSSLSNLIRQKESKFGDFEERKKRVFATLAQGTHSW